MITLLLVLSTVACEKLTYEPGFSPSKTYVYDYEGSLMVGHEEKSLVQSGMRLTCSVEISRVEPDTYLMKVNSFSIEEFHGILAKDGYTPSPELTKRLTEQLIHPIKFQYTKGHVGTILATPEVSTTVINILRGILSLLDVTIKDGESSYNLLEPGLQGSCYSNYFLEEDMKKNQLLVTRSINLKNCQEGRLKIQGMAYSMNCEECEKIGTNTAGTVTYSYSIEPKADEVLITKSSAKELQEFSPYNVRYGASVIEVNKRLTLSGVRKAQTNVPSRPYQYCGTLQYMFGNELQQIAVVLMRTNNLEEQIIETIQRLDKKPHNSPDPKISNDFLKLVQLLRYASLEDIEALWGKLSGMNDYRRWFLDSICTIPTSNSIKFFRDRIVNQELTEIEAASVLSVTLQIITADINTVNLAQEILITPFIQNSSVLRKVVMMAYGSLVYRHCSYPTGCSPEVLKPLHDFAAVAFSKNNEDDIILALKSLGNAGHPASIHTIMKSLPGFNNDNNYFPTQVQNAAVLSLRHIALKDPNTVQEIVLKILVNGGYDPEVRMYACLVLFETRPSLGLLLILTQSLLKETNLQVASFCYSHMKTLTWSSSPENREMAAACNVAVKVLGSKFDHLNHWYSKAFRFDYFHNGYLSGMAADIYLMNRIVNFIPTSILLKEKAYFMGTVSNLREFSFRIEGMQDLLKKISLPDRGANMEKILKTLSQELFGWKSTPVGNPNLSIYMKFFGQEVFFVDVNRNSVHEAIQVIGKKTGKGRYLGEILNNLMEGISFNWTNGLLASEIRFIESTSIGLPVENSQYYTFINDISLKIRSQVKTLEPTKLLNSDILIHVESVLSHVQHFIHFHGVNTDLIKIGSEYHATVNVTYPMKANVTLNIKDRKFDAAFPSCSQDHNIVEVKSQLFSVLRNAENTSGIKISQTLPESASGNIKENNFASSRNSKASEEVLFAEQSDQYTENLNRVQPEHHCYCSESHSFGLEMCLETRVANALFLRNSPLYNFLGNSHLKLVVKPAKAAAEIQIIRFKMNVPASKDPVELWSKLGDAFRYFKEAITSAQMSLTASTQSKLHGNSAWDQNITREAQVRFRGENIPLLVVASAQAESSVGKERGYESAVYMFLSGTADKLQLLISEEVQGKTWKFCADSEVAKSGRTSVTVVQWGKDFAEYKITANVANVFDKSKMLPTTRLKLYWDNLPSNIKEAASCVADYVPGIAFILGFSEIYQRNPSREISVMLKSTSPSTFDAVVKIPKVTLYQQGIQTPFYTQLESISTVKRDPDFMDVTYLSSLVTDGMKAQCLITGEHVMTFNNVKFPLALPKDCYHILTQDCTSELSFLVLMRQNSLKRKEISIKTLAGSLLISQEENEQTILMLNNRKYAFSDLPIKDQFGTLHVRLQNESLIVEAPALGLDRMYFTANHIKIVIQPWLRGKTCGLCGWADGETEKEFRTPNTQTARSHRGFIHSWLFSEELCSPCKLNRRLVTLNQHLGITGEELTCKSLEPVLRCRENCKASERTQVPIRFQCLPSDSDIRRDDVSHLENAVISQDAHVACVCSSSDCM